MDFLLGFSVIGIDRQTIEPRPSGTHRLSGLLSHDPFGHNLCYFGVQLVLAKKYGEHVLKKRKHDSVKVRQRPGIYKKWELLCRAGHWETQHDRYRVDTDSCQCGRVLHHSTYNCELLHFYFEIFPFLSWKVGKQETSSINSSLPSERKKIKTIAFYSPTSLSTVIIVISFVTIKSTTMEIVGKTKKRPKKELM